MPSCDTAASSPLWLVELVRAAAQVGMHNNANQTWQTPWGSLKLAPPTATVLATLPSAAGQPIATEEMRYGLRAAVVVLPAHPLLTTPQALAVVGPAAFGHGGVAYVPLGRYAEPAGIPR